MCSWGKRQIFIPTEKLLEEEQTLTTSAAFKPPLRKPYSPCGYLNTAERSERDSILGASSVWGNGVRPDFEASLAVRRFEVPKRWPVPTELTEALKSPRF
eukprot:913286-Amphidinium_carterae.1